MGNISEWAKRKKNRRLRQREEEPVLPVRAWGSGYGPSFGYNDPFTADPFLTSGWIEEPGWVEPACEPVHDTGTYSEPVHCDPSPSPPSYDPPADSGAGGGYSSD